MANKQVSLVRKCKTPDGWKRYPVVMSANGRVKPDAVLVGGTEVVYPVGHYELRSYSGDKIIWTRVTGGATEAKAELDQARKRAAAVATAKDAGVQVVLDPQRMSARNAQKEFVESATSRNKLEAAEIYERTLNHFFTSCPKTYIDEITHKDVVLWEARMRKEGLSDRTVHNRHMSLRAFFRYLKLDVKEIAGATPLYEKTVPEIFERDELTPFFASLMTDYDRLLFHLLLSTGLREREAMHLEWVDISYSRGVLLVKSKPRYKHKVKDSEQREIPISAKLMSQLREWREQLPAEFRLVFGKNGGTADEPDGHLLRRLKRLAREAGLNCGECETCVNPRKGSKGGKVYTMSPECARWYLHKFRATYITRLLRDGMDLRTVMKLSGHSDIESVMRYLRPAEGPEVQRRVNSIDWGTGL